MKKIFIIIILSFLFNNFSSAEIAISKFYWGKSEIKLNQHMASVLEYYFSSGTKGKYAEKQNSLWKPGFIVISNDGKRGHFFKHPATVGRVDGAPNYIGKARRICKEKSGKECFVFAKGYKILWNNKKFKLKKKDIMMGDTFKILEELGFIDSNTLENSTIYKITSSKYSQKEEYLKWPLN